jgi:hypothetical protein
VGKRVAVVQSNYVPWRGYFDLIAAVDEFIIYDDVQYTKDDWRNRNRIYTRHGPLWLTIPIITKGRQGQLIKDAEVVDTGWANKHWRSLEHNYSAAAGFAEVGDAIKDLYLGCSMKHLSEINHRFIAGICRLLGIDTRITWSMDYAIPPGERNERLVSLLAAADASHYLSGPAARDYLDEALFRDRGISVEYADYSGYDEYPQAFQPFEPKLSVLDLLLNTGSGAASHLKNTPSGEKTR